VSFLAGLLLAQDEPKWTDVETAVATAGQEDAAVLLTLLRLEREAPGDLRYRSASHDLVRGVLNRARPSFAPEARELARRIGPFV
jgi:hypothetical protein